MGYDNEWNSPDQIPQRAVNSQLIDKLGSLDTDVGGKSNRYSLSAYYNNSEWFVDGYMIYSALDLFSNFTYFLDDPVNGDEFQQVDDRTIYGGQVTRKLLTDLANNHVHHTFGIQYRFDDIDNVGLYKTKQRQRIATTREDSVEEFSVGLFWEGDIDLTDELSANLGVRYDYLDVKVDSNIAPNSGSADDNLLSVKAGLQYEMADNWQSYINVGQSFHSNDARGATITIDPTSGEAAEPVDLMVRGDGAEIGLRYHDGINYNISLSLWMLDLDSELLFVGDAGNTEAGRASRRKGIELAGYYWFDEHFSTDIELAWSHARFTEPADGDGDRVEGSLPFVASVGLNWSFLDDWRTSLRLRHFGQRSMDSFDEQKSGKFTVANLALTYMQAAWQLDVKVLNLFDSDDHDIDYYYASRLQNESLDGIEDSHFHPIEPRTVRVQLRYTF